MTATEASHKIDELAFQVDKSMRYHQRMRGFYDTAHRIFMFLIILTGGGALSEKPQYAVAAAAIIAAINLVWAPSHRARDHHLLHGRFSDLMTAIHTSEWTKENLSNWTSARLKIEKDEPPIFYALEADCDNEVRRAWGRTKKMVRIHFWHKRTMFFLRYRPDQFLPNEEKQVSAKSSL